MLLPLEFYQRESPIVARDLLGKVFVCRGKELIITETEAYLGPEDLASHARFGQTMRSKIMWEQGGVLYVYFIYGMYEMTNIVTGSVGEPGAILLRAGVDPQTGEKVVGPGRLSRYVGITREDKGHNLVDSPTLFIDDRGITPTNIEATPRIGIEYAGAWSQKKLRFVLP